jgi:hypothetical protein
MRIFTRAAARSSPCGALSPAPDVAGPRDPVLAGGLRVEALEHAVHDRPGGQLVRLRLEALRSQLVADEPAIRTLDPALERPGADGIARRELAEHGGIRERPRELGLHRLALGGEGARQLALARRLGGLEHHAV